MPKFKRGREKTQIPGLRGRRSAGFFTRMIDPRLRQNAQVNTRGEDDVFPVDQDKYGRRFLKTDDTLELRTDGSVGTSDIVSLSRYRITAVDSAIFETDHIVLGDPPSGSLNLTLPPAANMEGRSIYVKNVGAEGSSVLVIPFGAERIEQSTASWTLNAVVSGTPAVPGESIELLAYQGEWAII